MHRNLKHLLRLCVRGPLICLYLPHCPPISFPQEASEEPKEKSEKVKLETLSMLISLLKISDDHSLHLKQFENALGQLISIQAQILGDESQQDSIKVQFISFFA